MARRSARTRRIAECAVALGLLLSAAPGAPAGTISSSDLDIVEPEDIPTRTVSYRAAPGERNVLRVDLTADGVVVADARHPVVAGRNCFQEASGAARCPLAAGNKVFPNVQMRVFVALADRDDLLTVTQASRQGSVEVDGGAGADRLRTSSACCVQLWGGSGRDLLRSDSGSSRLTGGRGADTLLGGPGRDVLDGGAGRDRLRGGPGNDVLHGDDALASPARDTIHGGAGTDTVTYDGVRDAVFVDLRRPRKAGRAGERDRLQSIEGARGGHGPDVLIGDQRDNALEGGEGADRVLGLGGADRVDGGTSLPPGRDFLRGGAGDDALQPLGPLVDCGPGEDVVPMAPDPAGVPDSCEWTSDLAAPIQFAPRARLMGMRLSIRVRSTALQAVWLGIDVRQPSGAGVAPTTDVTLEPFEPKRLLLSLTRSGRRYFARQLRPVVLDFEAFADDDSGEWEALGVLGVTREPLAARARP